MYSSLLKSRYHFVLRKHRARGSSSTSRYKSTEPYKLTIDNIAVEVKGSRRPEFVPVNYIPPHLPQSSLQHLKWLLQKDFIGQDAFLIGPPSPRLRTLVMQFLELTQKEYEYVSMSRDTSDADLRQRREIKDHSAYHVDQAAVNAAIEGRVLVIDGIEKAEMNVLPVLNNLLENREMQLDDGRHLVSSSRYDQLLNKMGQSKLKSIGLVRVNENFRVIAIGIPVPRFKGNSLDPPLRSRFQGRHVKSIGYNDLIDEIKTKSSSDSINKLVSLGQLINGEEFQLTSRLMYFPIESLTILSRIVDSLPTVPENKLIKMVYPYDTFQNRQSGEKENKLKTALDALKIETADKKKFTNSVEEIKLSNGVAEVNLTYYGQKCSITMPCGTNSSLNKNASKSANVAHTDYHTNLLTDMLVCHGLGSRDLCVMGPRGCGKTILVEMFADLLGYEVETIMLYQDMTSRDLLQQRTTLASGDTVWRHSTLITAAITGKLAVLDGIHRIHPSTLSVLHRLICDRELQLYDGTRLLRSDRYDEIKSKTDRTSEEMTSSKLLRIHPSFRIIATCESGANDSQWLNSELLSLFLFSEMGFMSRKQECSVIRVASGFQPDPRLVDAAFNMRASADGALRHIARSSLTTRQLIRITRRIGEYPDTCLHDAITNSCLATFLPQNARKALWAELRKVGLEPIGRSKNGTDECINLRRDSKRIGEKLSEASMAKIPSVSFYETEEQNRIMTDVTRDLSMGEHVLLVGNQGVGKNRIIDHLLQTLNKPREYVQLHRDTTVQSLTLQPSIKDGVLVYEDSPLVRAIKNGHVLLVDEADKAPPPVTAILKQIMQSGHVTLADGRKIISMEKTDNSQIVEDGGQEYLKVHPDFRLVVLANRPGYPFLGHNFYGALGDAFSCHPIDNPDMRSETSMLSEFYGPDVKKGIITKIVSVFRDLRDLSDSGALPYPYSLREAIAITKHLQKYPEDPLANVLSNVFDFDSYDDPSLAAILEVLKRHGVIPPDATRLPNMVPRHIKATIEKTSTSTRTDFGGPKYGKVDPTGDPHVGGNTWAGGTGGRDTAGLGGAGGPYRLDHIGNTKEIFQVSDDVKDAVPAHIREAARKVAQQAFEARLKEIKMSKYDAGIYRKLSEPVAAQVEAIKRILQNLKAKENERHWLRNQTHGELDDNRLVDGLAGEKAVYRRRGEKPPETPEGMPALKKPKHLRLVVDCSGSMYRFNLYDGRLDRELSCVLLLMEALANHDSIIRYDVIGHSGESEEIGLVDRDKPPQNELERFKVLQVMHAHSQFCVAGDMTVEATARAVKNVRSDHDADEHFVVILSDANLSRYAIPPEVLTRALQADPKVNAFVVLIGSLGNQAQVLASKLPAGRAFVCEDTSKLPLIMQQIFSSALSDDS